MTKRFWFFNPPLNSDVIKNIHTAYSYSTKALKFKKKAFFIPENYASYKEKIGFSSRSRQSEMISRKSAKILKRFLHKETFNLFIILASNPVLFSRHHYKTKHHIFHSIAIHLFQKRKKTDSCSLKSTEKVTFPLT